MRSDKDKNKVKKKRYLLPQSTGQGVLLLFCLLVCFVFLTMLLVVDTFPAKYVAVMLAALAVSMVVIFCLLNSRKPKTKKRKTGVVLAVLLIIVMGVGSTYLFNTYTTFAKMTASGNQTEDFHVIVLKDGSYKTVDDIKGEEVVITKAKRSSYKEAKAKLMSESEVSYEQVDDYLAAGHMIVDEDGKTHDRIIFLNGPSYDMLCEEVDGFKKNTTIIHTISIEKESKDFAKRVDITKEPFNVYISGIDTFGSISTTARSDVNMIMTVNPQTKEILLTSMPRDSYVELHSYGAKDKLTHSGIYGVEESVATVEDWLGIDINYYIRVNFTTLVDIVDVIGGVTVESKYTFSSSVSDYSYTEGTNHLGGEAALYFARERKHLPGGDNERIKNQQRVLKGIITKITTSPVLLTKYTQLLDAIGDNMQTNLDDDDISAFVKMQLDDLGGWTIRTNSISGTGTSATTYSMGSRKLSVVVPDEDSVTKAQQEISKVMYPVEE